VLKSLVHTIFHQYNSQSRLALIIWLLFCWFSVLSNISWYSELQFVLKISFLVPYNTLELTIYLSLSSILFISSSYIHFIIPLRVAMEIPLELTQKLARRGKWTFEVSTSRWWVSSYVLSVHTHPIPNTTIHTLLVSPHTIQTCIYLTSLPNERTRILR
jgi:hypothetical protein